MVSRDKRMPLLNQGLGNKPQKLIPGSVHLLGTLLVVAFGTTHPFEDDRGAKRRGTHL